MSPDWMLFCIRPLENGLAKELVSDRVAQGFNHNGLSPMTSREAL